MGQTHAGKVAIVTGAGRGIGRAVTLGLLQAGASVVAVDIDNLESLLPPGSKRPEKFWEIAPADFRRGLEVNAVSPFAMAQDLADTGVTLNVADDSSGRWFPPHDERSLTRRY